MTKLLLILMMVGLWSGCGEEIEIHTERYDNGKMKKEYQSYTRGINYRPIKHGWYKSYYESGKVFWERNYVDGKREGKSVGYWENGEIRDEDIYKDGECVEMCEGDEND